MSSTPFSRLVTVRVTGSTNDDLRVALSGPDGRVDPEAARSWPHLSALRARAQTAGRGRAGRTWETPSSGALTVSVVLRPLVPAARLEWLPLLTGLAVQRALAPRLEGAGQRVRTKWPNDVVALPEETSTCAVADVPGWGPVARSPASCASWCPVRTASMATPAVRMGRATARRRLAPRCRR